VRVELFKYIRHMAPVSTRELAQVMDRSQPSLFYHCRELARCNLVEIVEWRKIGKRTEAVFAPAASQFFFELDSKPAEYIDIARKSVGILLRMGEREYDAAAKLLPQDRALNGRMKAQRTSSRLLDSDVAILKDKLEEIAEWMRQHDDAQRGHRVAMTALVTPVLHTRKK